MKQDLKLQKLAKELYVAAKAGDPDPALTLYLD